MLFDFATKLTQLLVTNPPSRGGSVYAGMSVAVFLYKVAHFRPEQVAHIAPEWVAQYSPDYSKSTRNKKTLQPRCTQDFKERYLIFSGH